MPELPEVQTIVNELNQQVRGRVIKSVNILRDSIIGNKKSLFEKTVKNKLIHSIERKGKYILIDLKPKCWLIVHLRMTGKFIVQQSPISIHKHDRVVFELDNDQVMIFNDVRCFGTIEVVTSIAENKKLNQLGWDPWNKQLTISNLRMKLKNRNVSIKALLLDQSIIAGLGNIYVSEILFDAKISPFLRGNQLSKAQLSRLVNSTRYILTEALKYNGTSISDYRRVDDKQGSFQNFLKVYGKKDQPCAKCLTPISKTKQNQRSTYHCSQCQK